jgi:hypothetical protein
MLGSLAGATAGASMALIGDSVNSEMDAVDAVSAGGMGGESGEGGIDIGGVGTMECNTTAVVRFFMLAHF